MSVPPQKNRLECVEEDLKVKKSTTKGIVFVYDRQNHPSIGWCTLITEEITN